MCNYLCKYVDLYSSAQEYMNVYIISRYTHVCVYIYEILTNISACVFRFKHMYIYILLMIAYS